MTEYREAFEIGAEDSKRIDKAAKAMLDALGVEWSNTNLEQARVFVMAMETFIERNAETPDAWKGVGYLGNLMYLHGKAQRLMNALWYKQSKGRGDKPIDNAIDAMNFAAFFVRCYEAKDPIGHPSGQTVHDSQSTNVREIIDLGDDPPDGTIDEGYTGPIPPITEQHLSKSKILNNPPKRGGHSYLRAEQRLVYQAGGYQLIMAKDDASRCPWNRGHEIGDDARCVGEVNHGPAPHINKRDEVWED